MITQLRSARFRVIGRMPGATGLGCLIQVALALYLLPALLIVLVVGAFGMLVLAVVRVVTAIVSGPNRCSHSGRTKSPLI
jgi:hypothetical protein